MTQNQSDRTSQLPSCTACTSSKSRVEYDDSKIRLLRCPECGLLYVNPVPHTEAHPSNSLYERGYQNQIDREQMRVNKILAPQIIELSNQGKLSGKRILDIGCGFGFFIKKMEENGWQVYGCEQNAIAVDYARKMSLNVYTDLKHEHIWRENYFDVITLWNVLDSLDKPFEMLQACRYLLRPGGTLVIRVHNITPNFVLWGFSGKKALKPCFSIPLCLHFFTTKSIKSLLRRSGFNDLQLVKSPMGDIAHNLIKRFGKLRARMLVKILEIVNAAIIKITFSRSAGFLSITMTAKNSK